MVRHKMKGTGRNARVAEQIQKDIAILIQREIDIATAGLITLTAVDLSADFAHAKVYYTVIGAEPEKAQKALDEKANWFHSQLFKMMHIHTVPMLRFLYDDRMARGMQVRKLIEQVNRKQQGAGDDGRLPDEDLNPRLGLKGPSGES